MNPMSLDLKELENTSWLSRDGASLEFRTLKVGEESGELAAAVLNHLDSPNKSKSSQDNVLEEGCDTLITVFDVLFRTGHHIGEIQTMMNRKIGKWQSKLEAKCLEN